MTAYADRRLRPLRRRFCTTRTPPRSAIRLRKPCTRLRYRFLGWKVRLMESPPEGVQQPPRTAVVYRRTRPAIVIPPVSLIRRPACLAIPTGLCYTPRPEADGVSVRAPSQYRLLRTNSINLTLHDQTTV